MAKKLCCCRISTWAMIISWLKIIFHVMYIVLCTLSLMGILGGNENLKTAIQNHPEKYPGYYKVVEYAYEYLLFYLFCLVGYNILGLPMNIVLLKGALQRNERKLTIWLYFTLSNVIIMLPYVMFRYISSDSVTNSAIRLALNYLLELFCLWIVYSVLQEIRTERMNESQQCFNFSPQVVLTNKTDAASTMSHGPSEPPPPHLQQQHQQQQQLLPHGSAPVTRKDPYADYNLT